MAERPNPTQGILLTHFIVAEDVERSRAFYTDVLGGESVREGEPSIVQLANSWIIINVGGGPTVDKPDVILETPPDPTRSSSFLNIRVADIHSVYEDWRSRGGRVHHPAPGPRERDPLLHTGSRRTPDRGRTDDGALGPGDRTEMSCHRAHHGLGDWLEKHLLGHRRHDRTLRVPDDAAQHAAATTLTRLWTSWRCHS